MKALLLRAPRQLELCDIAPPELSPGQVRVRIRNVGVCGSDYSSIAGKLPFTRFPIIPGHEASGEVIESAGAGPWAAGDRVLIHPILGRRDDPAFQCGAVHHSRFTEVLGVVSRNGAYAEETVLEDYMLRGVPPEMDFESAAMVEPVAVAVRALRQGALQPGDRVLIFGAGNIGLLLVQAARALGAGHVAVTDLVPSKLALAKTLGADETLLAPATAAEDHFDVVIDGVGSEQSVRDGLTACVRGGRIVVYGVPAGDIVYPLKAAFSKDITLATSRLYDGNFDTAIELVASGKVRVKEIITHRIGLAEAPEVISRIIDGREPAIKVMISVC